MLEGTNSLVVHELAALFCTPNADPPLCDQLLAPALLLVPMGNKRMRFKTT